MILYMDTSALVKLVVNEEGRDLVFAALDATSSVATSVIAYAECRAAFARRQRAGDIDVNRLKALVGKLDDTWPSIAHHPVSELTSQSAGHLAEVHALRGFDAIHLATALRVGEVFGDVRFLAFDDRLNAAARDASLLLYGEEPREAE